MAVVFGNFIYSAKNKMRKHSKIKELSRPDSKLTFLS